MFEHTMATCITTAAPGLFADLYEFTMARAYVEEGMHDTAVFDVFVRRLPEQRNFLVACGVSTVLDSLEQARFTSDDIAYLESLGHFPTSFLAWLHQWRFAGDVYAVLDGTPVFAGEPILQIAAPIAQAQLVETLVLNQIHLQTVLASKAVRVVAAARGRRVIDFGARRAHGIDAAVKAARAFYVAGVHGTSNVLASRCFRIPLTGTMAHSYIQAHDDELEAFRAFTRVFPGTVLLVDTYDAVEGVRRVIDVMRESPTAVSAVRIDSGDLAVLAGETRRLLNDAGFRHVEIIVSNSLDEHEIARLIACSAPIDGFGVGTSMAVSGDVPALDLVYKLSEYCGSGRTKLAAGKAVFPGQKQVFRCERDGRSVFDVIATADEGVDGRPLLRQVMRAGKRLAAGDDDLQSARGRVADEVARLPPHVTALEPARPAYPIAISARLQAAHDEVRQRVRRQRELSSTSIGGDT